MNEITLGIMNDCENFHWLGSLFFSCLRLTLVYSNVICEWREDLRLFTQGLVICEK